MGRKDPIIYKAFDSYFDAKGKSLDRWTSPVRGLAAFSIGVLGHSYSKTKDVGLKVVLTCSYFGATIVHYLGHMDP